VIEILTAGDPTADRENPFATLVDPNLWDDADFVPLPEQMPQDLRLDLSVSSTNRPDT
jgi:hypothetical protein